MLGVLEDAEKNHHFYSQGLRVREVTYDIYRGTLHPLNATHTWHMGTMNCSLFLPETQQNEKI